MGLVDVIRFTRRNKYDWINFIKKVFGNLLCFKKKNQSPSSPIQSATCQITFLRQLSQPTGTTCAHLTIQKSPSEKNRHPGIFAHLKKNCSTGLLFWEKVFFWLGRLEICALLICSTVLLISKKVIVCKKGVQLICSSESLKISALLCYAAHMKKSAHLVSCTQLKCSCGLLFWTAQPTKSGQLAWLI